MELVLIVRGWRCGGYWLYEMMSLGCDEMEGVREDCHPAVVVTYFGHSVIYVFVFGYQSSTNFIISISLWGYL